MWRTAPVQLGVPVEAGAGVAVRKGSICVVTEVRTCNGAEAGWRWRDNVEKVELKCLLATEIGNTCDRASKYENKQIQRDKASVCEE